MSDKNQAPGALTDLPTAAYVHDLTMSMREIDRLKIIQAIVDGNLKPIRAAERLQISTRQVRRLVSRYRAE